MDIRYVVDELAQRQTGTRDHLLICSSLVIASTHFKFNTSYIFSQFSKSLAMSLFITSLFCMFHVRLSVSVLFCMSLRTRALIVLSSIQNYLHFFCIMKRVTRHAQTRSLHCPNYAKCDNLILAIS